MKFRKLYNILTILAISACILDYSVTQIGFAKFSPWFEANPYVRILMQWLDPHLASTIVFLVTLTLVLGSYKLLSKALMEKPYSESLRDVGRYVWTANNVKSRDIIIFASIAIYITFAYIHLLGLITWLKLLIT